MTYPGPGAGPATGAREIGLQTLTGTDDTAAPAATFRRFPGISAITVLIPAHNEAASIGATLASLRDQTMRPSRIVVVADNCTDATAAIAARHGAGVFATQGNTARKAGALNQALTRILPGLSPDDLVLVMDADSLLSRDWLRAAAAWLMERPAVGAVCGMFLGEPGAGLVGQFQRNEYWRYARTVRRRIQAAVLSGTGTLFRVCALREVAGERGRRLPGIPGEFYSSVSITEDDEITLALKTLGHFCVPVSGCNTTTEVMPTWRDLWRQRVRWQTGAIRDLLGYGCTRVTLPYWLRQAGIYAGLIAAAFTRHPAFNAAWTCGVLAVSFTERCWTVRRAGWRGMLLSALMVPELAYDVFRMAVFIWSGIAALARVDLAWGHVVKQAVR